MSASPPRHRSVLACVAALIGGIGNGVEWPSVISIVQRLTPPHLHGRMMGAVESMTALSLAIGLPLGGALVALSSPRAAFLVVGMGATAMTFAFLRLCCTVSTPPRAGRQHQVIDGSRSAHPDGRKRL